MDNTDTKISFTKEELEKLEKLGEQIMDNLIEILGKPDTEINFPRYIISLSSVAIGYMVTNGIADFNIETDKYGLSLWQKAEG